MSVLNVGIASNSCRDIHKIANVNLKSQIKFGDISVWTKVETKHGHGLRHICLMGELMSYSSIVSVFPTVTDGGQ